MIFLVSEIRVHLSPGGTLVAISSFCSTIFLGFSFMWIHIVVLAKIDEFMSHVFVIKY